MTAEYVDASLSLAAMSGGSAMEATKAAPVPRPTMKTSGRTKSVSPNSRPSDPTTAMPPAKT